MNLADFYKDIVAKEPYVDVEVFFEKIDSFEEIPLISRDRRLAVLQALLDQEDVSEFLLGFAYFMINTIRTIAHSRKMQLGLTAITFTNFDEDDCGSALVPHLFIFPDEAGQRLHQRLSRQSPGADSPEMGRTKCLFKSCHLFGQFTFLESRYFDEACNEELVRIYAIPVAAPTPPAQSAQ